VTLPDITSRDEWVTARRALLAREKDHTRAKDALNADRRRLPMVRIEKAYAFEGPDGTCSFADLFEGRRQLVMQHFMFDPSWENGCSSCTADCDEMSDGLRAHLAARETTYVCVSRAPYAKLAAYKATRGWNFPWYSSFGSDFNYDFHTTIDESVAPLEINYRSKEELVALPAFAWVADEPQPYEMPGRSCFLREGDDIFHTYSVFGRGSEDLGGAYGVLDMTALGRQEDWEEPKGRVESPYGANPDFST
jgi:predicted dithiol-disulfide oxidoreductase (DUF899 family)